MRGVLGHCCQLAHCVRKLLVIHERHVHDCMSGRSSGLRVAQPARLKFWPCGIVAWCLAKAFCEWIRCHHAGCSDVRGCVGMDASVFAFSSSCDCTTALIMTGHWPLYASSGQHTPGPTVTA